MKMENSYYSIDYIKRTRLLRKQTCTPHTYTTEMCGVTGPFPTMEKAEEIRRILGDDLIIKMENDCIIIV